MISQLVVFIVELGALLAIVPDEFKFILENNKRLYNWTRFLQQEKDMQSFR
jgi:hypothetical protein